MKSNLTQLLEEHSKVEPVSTDLSSLFFDGRLLHYIWMRSRFVVGLHTINAIANIFRYGLILNFFPIYSLIGIYFWLQILNLMDGFFWGFLEPFRRLEKDRFQLNQYRKLLGPYITFWLCVVGLVCGFYFHFNLSNVVFGSRIFSIFDAIGLLFVLRFAWSSLIVIYRAPLQIESRLNGLGEMGVLLPLPALAGVEIISLIFLWLGFQVFGVWSIPLSMMFEFLGKESIRFYRLYKIYELKHLTLQVLVPSFRSKHFSLIGSLVAGLCSSLMRVESVILGMLFHFYLGVSDEFVGYQLQVSAPFLKLLSDWPRFLIMEFRRNFTSLRNWIFAVLFPRLYGVGVLGGVGVGILLSVILDFVSVSENSKGLGIFDALSVPIFFGIILSISIVTLQMTLLFSRTQFLVMSASVIPLVALFGGRGDLALYIIFILNIVYFIWLKRIFSISRWMKSNQCKSTKRGTFIKLFHGILRSSWLKEFGKKFSVKQVLDVGRSTLFLPEGILIPSVLKQLPGTFRVIREGMLLRDHHLDEPSQSLVTRYVWRYGSPLSSLIVSAAEKRMILESGIFYFETGRHNRGSNRSAYKCEGHLEGRQITIKLG